MAAYFRYACGMNQDTSSKPLIAGRFRGFLPVVVDVETGGVNAATDALLEIAAVLLDMDEDGQMYRRQTISFHVEPFPGAVLNEDSMAVNGIDPFHPFRFAVPEEKALDAVFKEVRKAVKSAACTRAVLVGHNAFFDLAFVNAAANRNKIKRNPFHPFSSFDTATLAGMAYGQTVLSRATVAAGLGWNSEAAHSAIYDAEITADLFCTIINLWQRMGGWRG